MKPSVLQNPRSSIKKASATVYTRRYNAEVSAVGTMIDDELGGDEYQRKIERLTALAALFERDPNDEKVKKEYLQLLREQYGDQAD